MINAAKCYLYITTPYLICDREILSALRIASKKGVDVRYSSSQGIMTLDFALLRLQFLQQCLSNGHAS